MIFELHKSVIECEERELIFIIADAESKTCYGILTIKKIDIDNERGALMKLRKRRAPSSEKVVVSERKEKRYECAPCDYVSRAQCITARHAAQILQHGIEPTKCELCEYKTIYKSILKRHHERMHYIKSRSESESELELDLESELELESSIVPLN